MYGGMSERSNISKVVSEGNNWVAERTSDLLNEPFLRLPAKPRILIYFP